MQEQDFLYFLTDENSRFYSVDSFENVVISTTPKPLTFSPDGWDQISIVVQRSLKYFGLERSFTIPLNFVEDGGKIIKHLYYNQGIEAKLFLLILEQKIFIDPIYYGFYYDSLYKGEIDLSTFSHQGPRVTVNVIEGGLAKLLRANESTTYEIDIDASASAVNVQMDGLRFHNTALYKVTDGEYTGGILVLHKVPVAYTNSETTSVNVVHASQTILNDTGERILKNSGASYPARIFGSIKFQIKYAAQTYTVFIRMLKPDGSTTLLFTQAINTSNGIDYTISFDFNTTILAGSEVYIDAQYIADASPENLVNMKIIYYQTNINISDQTILPTTYIKGRTPLDVVQELLDKITDRKYQVKSDLLTLNSNIIITSGDAIRGLSGGKIKTSLSQFFDAFNAILNLGMGILDNKLVIEEKSFWFEPATVIDLGEVSDLKVSVASDFIFNTIKAGYPVQNYSSGDSGSGVNGRDEFNNTHIYTTPIARISKELTLISEYRADMYGIEFTRINSEGKKTTDTSSDNDTFLIKVNPPVKIHSTGNPIDDFNYYELDRSLNAGATGLIDAPTAFNIGLSTKRGFLNHGWFIRSFLDKLEGGVLKFQTTEKNADLVAAGITEKADVAIGSLADKKFLPVLLEFETKVPDNLNDIITANPIVSYTFSYQGIRLSGISMKSGIEPSTNKSQVYQLLADASNDLSTLINIFE